MPNPMMMLFRGQLMEAVPLPTEDLSGQTIIVTGANSGLGLDAAKHLYRLNCSRIILACRSLAKADGARKEIMETALDDTIILKNACATDPEFIANSTLAKVSKTNLTIDTWELNMSSYASVRSFAERCKSLPRLDAVLLNAGILTGEFRLAEGFEETLTVNVVSTFMLASLLLPQLQVMARRYYINTRIAVVGSLVHYLADQKTITKRISPAGSIFEHITNLPASTLSDRYNLSKLLVMLLVRHMATVVAPHTGEEYTVTINNIAPGYCRTPFFRNESGFIRDASQKIIGRDQEVGARTLVNGVCAGPETHGKYLSECKVKAYSPFCDSKDGKAIAARMWKEITNLAEPAPAYT